MSPEQQYLRPVENLLQVPNETSPILGARDVNKAYGPVTVLQGINVNFLAGEIHAIVGENGAGKSTLMKILSGVVEPSLGQVLYEGKPVETGNLRGMENLGIRLIHQELNLAEDLSVLENLFLGEEQTWRRQSKSLRMAGCSRRGVGRDQGMTGPRKSMASTSMRTTMCGWAEPEATTTRS